MNEAITNLCRKQLKAFDLKCRGKVGDYALAVAEIRSDLKAEPIKGIDRDAVSTSAKKAMQVVATQARRGDVDKKGYEASLKHGDALFEADAKWSLSDACVEWAEEKMPSLLAQYDATLNACLTAGLSTNELAKSVAFIEGKFAEWKKAEAEARKKRVENLKKQEAEKQTAEAANA